MNLFWPGDHLGWRLLVQTNHLDLGLSGNPSDWDTVAGTTLVTATNLPLGTANLNAYYRLIYP